MTEQLALPEPIEPIALTVMPAPIALTGLHKLTVQSAPTVPGQVVANGHLVIATRDQPVVIVQAMTANRDPLVVIVPTGRPEQSVQVRTRALAEKIRSTSALSVARRATSMSEVLNAVVSEVSNAVLSEASSVNAANVVTAAVPNAHVSIALYQRTGDPRTGDQTAHIPNARVMTAMSSASLRKMTSCSSGWRLRQSRRPMFRM